MNLQPIHDAMRRANEQANNKAEEQDNRETSVQQIRGQMRAAVDRVMGEASLYAPEEASIALIQSQGDTVEAAEILRAYRQTKSRKYYSEILDTEKMQISRRISSAFREIPKGQVLGPTRDYTQRLLDETIAGENEVTAQKNRARLREELSGSINQEVPSDGFPRVSDILKEQGMVKAVNEDEDRGVRDILKEPISFPAPRSAALQILARSDTSSLMAIGYSAMRGQGGDHPTIGELRVGWARLKIRDARGRTRCIGKIKVTESANISKIKTRKKDPVPYMSLGYGLCFGQNETKAICMGILDRSLRIPGDASPAISQEFALNHLDGPEAQGFITSLKIPSHVEMASELNNLREAIKRHEANLRQKQKVARDKQVSKQTY